MKTIIRTTTEHRDVKPFDLKKQVEEYRQSDEFKKEVEDGERKAEQSA